MSKRRYRGANSNPQFLKGFLLASGIFFIASILLYNFGYLSFQGLSKDSSGASITPRKDLKCGQTSTGPVPGATDIISPTVTLVDPPDGTIIDRSEVREEQKDYKTYGQIIVETTINASDNVGIRHMEWCVNDILDGTNVYAAPSYTFPARLSTKLGTYVIKAIVYDTSGNAGEASISVKLVQ